jgi:hypothetical protein
MDGRTVNHRGVETDIECGIFCQMVDADLDILGAAAEDGLAITGGRSVWHWLIASAKAQEAAAASTSIAIAQTNIAKH